MKLGTFREDGAEKMAVMVGDRILDVPSAKEVLGGRYGALVTCCMRCFIESGATGLDLLGALVDEAKAKADLWRDLSSVTLGPPVPKPNKFLALATNYREHIAEGDFAKMPEKEDKITPYVFMKPPSTTVIATEDPIVMPKVGVAIDWELELGVIIGRKGKYIPEAEALDYVFGYTVINDVSERKLFASKERTKDRDMDGFFDWLNGKWLDGFAPTGPVLVTRDEIDDPRNLHAQLTVNGEVKQDFNTGDMIFDIPATIAFISRIMTLEPGDIIATGTSAGVGDSQGIYLTAGDLVEGEIERIGVLRNR
ncbi:MAG: fumarylacetoacetate hydrolase family protein, partial [Candidatus Latescibacteria bacterium]|nr:fumarylacetoacetate hydrolase family protein [Candidatus Latescibacterota bacterium]